MIDEKQIKMAVKLGSVIGNIGGNLGTGNHLTMALLEQYTPEEIEELVLTLGSVRDKVRDEIAQDRKELYG